MRKELTDERKKREVANPKDYALLTNDMTKAWPRMSVKEYKQYKDLKKENLRDNMPNVELVMNMLAEVTTTVISKKEKKLKHLQKTNKYQLKERVCRSHKR